MSRWSSSLHMPWETLTLISRWNSSSQVSWKNSTIYIQIVANGINFDPRNRSNIVSNILTVSLTLSYTFLLINILLQNTVTYSRSHVHSGHQFISNGANSSEKFIHTLCLKYVSETKSTDRIAVTLQLQKHNTRVTVYCTEHIMIMQPVVIKT